MNVPKSVYKTGFKEILNVKKKLKDYHIWQIWIEERDEKNSEYVRFMSLIMKWGFAIV